MSASTPATPVVHDALLVGATGLVGRECLRLLLEDEAFSRIVVPTRRALPDHEPHRRTKLESHIIDFDRLGAYGNLFAVGQILCTLGTTIKQAGSQDRFRRVDFGYPLEIAKLGLEHGARHFLLVSALGANARSRIFYNRVKGELEEALSALPYRSLTIVRPSLLLGDRPESRRGEEVERRFSFLVPPKYKPVYAHDVAAALIQAAKEDRPVRRVIESAEIQKT